MPLCRGPELCQPVLTMPCGSRKCSIPHPRAAAAPLHRKSRAAQQTACQPHTPDTTAPKRSSARTCASHPWQQLLLRRGCPRSSCTSASGRHMPSQQQQQGTGQPGAAQARTCQEARHPSEAISRAGSSLHPGLRQSAWHRGTACAARGASRGWWPGWRGVASPSRLSGTEPALRCCQHCSWLEGMA